MLILIILTVIIRLHDVQSPGYVRHMIEVTRYLLPAFWQINNLGIAISLRQRPFAFADTQRLVRCNAQWDGRSPQVPKILKGCTMLPVNYCGLMLCCVLCCWTVNYDEHMSDLAVLSLVFSVIFRGIRQMYSSDECPHSYSMSRAVVP